MKKKVVAGLTSIILAVVLIFGGVTFYNNHQQKKFEKQMASFESVDTMKHPKESTIKIDGVEVPLSSAPKVTTKTTTKKSTKIQKLKKKASKSKVTTIRKTKTTTVQLIQSGSKGTTVKTLGAKADKKILNAFDTLKFKFVINKNASHTGVFSVRNHKIEIQSAKDYVLLHELGHFANFLAGDKVSTSEWNKIYKAEKSKYTGYNKAYVTKTASEYFAESYRDYRENPTALKSKRPRTYQFVKKTINGISDSDVQEIKDTYGEYWGL